MTPPTSGISTADASTLTVPLQRLPGQEDVPLPAYQSDHAAGLDVCAAVSETLTVEPGERALIPTGFALAVPVGYEAQLRPRSGLAVKQGLTLPNSPGTIDADYRGEVKVAVINLGQKPVEITRGMRIAQILIKPVPRIGWEEVAELPPTDRGEGGFGHTGA